MPSKANLVIITVLLLTILAQHRIVMSLAPHLLYSVIQNTPFEPTDPPMPLDLDTLNQLTSIPLVGQLFLQQKVKAMVQNRSWSSVLTQCQKIGSMHFGLGKRLLPLRAIAECATYQFFKCEETIRQIKMESPDLLSNIRPLSILVESLYKKKQQAADQDQRVLMAQL